jgi:hypothetical protein
VRTGHTGCSDDGCGVNVRGGSGDSGAEFLAAGLVFTGCTLRESSDHVFGQVGCCFQDHGQFVGSEFGPSDSAAAGLQTLNDPSAALFDSVVAVIGRC